MTSRHKNSSHGRFSKKQKKASRSMMSKRRGGGFNRSSSGGGLGSLGPNVGILASILPFLFRSRARG